MIRKCYRTRIGRAMMMVFLALIVPLVVLGVFMATTSASTIRSEIVQNYNNLLHMSSNQFTERLMDARQLAISLTVDDDLNSFCISSDSRRDLFRYWLFQDRLRSYASQRMMENRISVWLPRQGWVISTHDSIYRVGESERPALTSADALERAVWGVHPSVADPEKTCLSLSVGYVHEQQSNAIFLHRDHSGRNLRGPRAAGRLGRHRRRVSGRAGRRAVHGGFFRAGSAGAG